MKEDVIISLTPNQLAPHGTTYGPCHTMGDSLQAGSAAMWNMASLTLSKSGPGVFFNMCCGPVPSYRIENHSITKKNQVGRDLRRSLVRPPVPSGVRCGTRAGHPLFCTFGSWKPPGMVGTWEPPETTQLLLATRSTAWLKYRKL